MQVFSNEPNKVKPQFKEIPENSKHAMQSLLDENTKRDKMPPVLYVKYFYEDLRKWCEVHGAANLPVEVVDLEILAWCISQGDAYGKYCADNFSHFLEGK